MANFRLFRRPKRAPILERALPQTTDDSHVQGVTGFLGDTSAGILPEHARQLADSAPYCRAAIDLLKAKVARAERAIIPIDPNKHYDPRLQAALTGLLENPNPKGDSWRTFIEPVLEDFLIIGKGGWEYTANYRGMPLALIPFDAALMHIVPNWDGRDPRAPRYIWRPRGTAGVGLRNDEVSLLLDNPSSHRAEGWSKLAILRRTIESDVAADGYVRSLMQKYLPPGWLHLGKNSTARQVKETAASLRANVLGQGGVLVTGNLDDPKFTSLWAGSSRENELRDWADYWGRKVAIVFGLSPMDLGITQDVNRATATTAAELSSESGSISLLMLIEDYWNREVAAKFGPAQRTNLHLQFKDVTSAERLRRAELVKTLSGDMPTLTLNELREIQHREPMAGGNAIFAMTAKGPVSVLGTDATPLIVDEQEQVADMEDEEAAEGGTPDPPAAPDRATPDAQAAAYAHALVRAYLRLWCGRLDWRARLEPDEAASLLAFVRRQLVLRRERSSDLSDARQACRLDRYEHRLTHEIDLATPAGPVPAYRLLGIAEGAA